MADNNEDRARNKRFGTDDRRWSSTCRVLSGWAIERSGDIMCGLHHAKGDEQCEFLGLASKPRSAISPSLASKPMAQFLGLCLKTEVDGLVIWSSKSPRWFLGLDLKTKWEEVCQFAPQNR
jgi:hypothetical protein